VAVDKAGQHQPAVDIDFAGLRLQTWRNRDNPAIGYADVDGRIRRQRRRAAKDQVKAFARSWKRQIRDETKTIGSGAHRQLQMVCLFRHELFKLCACNLSAGL